MFSQFFTGFMESKFNFENFEKKGSLIAYGFPMI